MGPCRRCEFLDCACVDDLSTGNYPTLFAAMLRTSTLSKRSSSYLPAGHRAIVTCPISKSSLGLAGVPFPGHTELLAHFGGVDSYIMMLANPKIRVSLVTIHIPLNEVPGRITEQRVFDCIRITCRSLQQRLSLKKPFIKVCGLNPHAGEQGIMGHEEEMIDTRGRHAPGR